MHRLLKFIVWMVVAAIALLTLVVGVLFLPSVQKALLVRALSGPDTAVSVEEVRVRPGTATLRGFQLETSEARVEVGDFGSRFRLGPLLWERTVDVVSLTVTDLGIETETPEDPPEVDPWEVFDGVLPDVPVDFRVELAEVSGRLRAGDGPVVVFAAEARSLDSRSEGGWLSVRCEVDDPVLPGEKPWVADIELRPAFDAEGVFHALEAELDLGSDGERDPLVRSRFQARRIEQGETYEIEMSSPAGGHPDKVLLRADGEWFRADHRIGGRAIVDVEEVNLPDFPGGEDLPGFSFEAENAFSINRSGDLTLTAESQIRVHDLAARFGLPEALDELFVIGSLDLARAGKRLDINALDIDVAERTGADLARAYLASALQFDLDRGENGFFPEFEEPVLLVDLPGIPSELIEPFLGDLGVSSDPLTAGFELYARGGRLELETPEPLSLRDVVLTDPVGTLLLESDLTLRPSGYLSPSDFGFRLAGEGAVTPVEAFDLEFDVSGDLPLAESTARFRLHADGIGGNEMVAGGEIAGSVVTSHSNGGFVPGEIRFSIESSARPAHGSPVRFPARVDLDGELSREEAAWPDWIRALEVSVFGDRESVLARLRLEQPIRIDAGDPFLNGLPHGALLTLESESIRLGDWVSDDMGELFHGGDLRGGLRLRRDEEGLRLDPLDDFIEVADIRSAAWGNGAGLPARLRFVPRFRFSDGAWGVRIEDFETSVDDRVLVRASMEADWTPAALANGAEQLTGGIAARGDLAAWREVPGVAWPPDLEAGEFDFATDLYGELEELSISWDGQLVVPEMRSRSTGREYAASTEFSGTATASGIIGRLVAVVGDGELEQQAELTADAVFDSENGTPLVRLRGDSEFIDLLQLQDLAELFAFPQPADPEPAEPGEWNGLLPVGLELVLSVERMRVLPEFEVYELRIDVIGDEDVVDLRQARLAWPDEGSLEATGFFSANREAFMLTAAGQASGIDIDDLSRRTQGLDESVVTGLFGLEFEVSSRGANPDELVRNLEGILDVSGENGRLALNIPDGRMQRVRQITGMQEGAIGSLVARLAGAPPGVQALAESLNLLTDIPYDTMDVRMAMGEATTLIVERMELGGPYLFVLGAGRLEEIDFAALEETPLYLNVEIGARDPLREQFRVLNLLSQQTNELGYQLLNRRPIHVGGNLGNPDIREVWDLLIDAGVGAATARDGEDRDPVQDTIRGIRDILGR